MNEVSDFYGIILWHFIIMIHHLYSPQYGKKQLKSTVNIRNVRVVLVLKHESHKHQIPLTSTSGTS